jgi:hypothetical protein
MRHLRLVASFCFAEQQVYVFGHDDVTDDEESVAHTRPFQRFFEESAHGRIEPLAPTVTTESDEVKVSAVLITMETEGTGWRLVRSAGLVSDVRKNPWVSQTRAYPGHPSGIIE